MGIKGQVEDMRYQSYTATLNLVSTTNTKILNKIHGAQARTVNITKEPAITLVSFSILSKIFQMNVAYMI